MISSWTGRNDYCEHGGDVGIVGRGQALEQAFEAAAVAMFARMNPPAAGCDTETVRVDFREADIELALLHWLTRLLCKSHQLGMVFERFLLEREGSLWRGLASGAPGPQPNARGWWLLDVTACDLSVRQLAAGWEARCVFDFRRGPAAHREGGAGAQPPGSGPGAPH